MTHRTILYITARIPYPLNWGTPIRQFHLLAAYARVGRVRLAFFYNDEEELTAIEALKPYCASVHPVPFKSTYGESTFAELPVWRKRLAQSITLQPSLAILHSSREMERVVAELSPASDLIHVARLEMVPHVASLFKRRTKDQRFVLDLDDIATVVKKRMIRTDPTIPWKRKAVEHFDVFRLWRYQRKAVDTFDRIFVCSRRDQEYFRSEKVIAVPNGASALSDGLPDESDGQTLLYLGLLSYWPNVDGLFFFLKEIFPLIQKEIGDARLLVVGRDPSPEIVRLHDGRTVCVEANVPSVEKYYRQATLSVVPLRVGGGTRLKILEAFAFERPVVSTSIGCEGLEVVDGDHLLIADDPRSFARACVDLLRDPSLRRRLTVSAKGLVHRKYVWSSIQSRVEDLTRELLGTFGE